MTNINKPKILLYDIETLPNKGYFFQCSDRRGNYINPEFITQERSIISIAYKWYKDGDTSEVVSVADFPTTFEKDPFNDKQVLESFAPVLAEADYIVGHYSDKFDNKYIQARALINGLPPLNIPIEVDTCKLLKKHFLLNANKLGYVGKLLGLGDKNPMGWGDWVGCAEGNIESVIKMAEYNKQDVLLLEAVFEKILPHVKSKINMHAGSETVGCSACGGEHLNKYGRKIGAGAKIYQKYQCQSCGHIQHDRTNPIAG